MSSFYKFYIASEKTPQQIADIAAAANNSKATQHQETFTFGIPGYSVTSGYFSYYLSSESSKERSNDWLNSYGFIPDIELTLDHYPNSDSQWTYSGIKKSVAEILRQEEGNAILLKNGDIPIIERISGEITFTDRNDGWLPDNANWLKEELDKVGLKYKVKHLEYRQV